MRWLRQRRVWATASLSAAVIAGLVAAALLTGGSARASSPLQGFANCTELHNYYKARAHDLINQRHDYIDEPWIEVEEAAEEEADADFADSAESAPSGEAETATEEAVADDGEVSDSGTNVQERGVDESDIIKTDGQYLYILRPDALLIAEIVDGGGPVEVGRIRFQRLRPQSGTADHRQQSPRHPTNRRHRLRL